MRAASRILWWHWIVLFNIIFIAGTLFYNYIPHDVWRFSSRIFGPLNLQREMSIATWWSGILIFIVGCYFYRLSYKDPENKKYWLIFSIIFFILSFDEIASLHERIGKLKYILGFAGAVVFFIAFWGLVKNERTRLTALLILTGFLLYGFVAVQEYIEYNVSIPPELWGLRIAIEEGSELFGSFVILYGLIKLDRKKSNKKLEEIIPQRDDLHFFPHFLIIGLILNSIISFLVLPNLNDLGQRGNPAVWYPTIIYFALCIYAYRYAQDRKKDKTIWKFASVFFLVSSMLVMEGKLFIPNDYTEVVNNIFPENSLLFINQLILILILIKLSGKKITSTLHFIIPCILILASIYFMNEVQWIYFSLTLFSFLITLVISGLTGAYAIYSLPIIRGLKIKSGLTK